MKGDKARKRCGFQRGHTPYYRKCVNAEPLVEESTCYVRLPRDQHEIVCKPGPGVDPTVDVTGLGGRFRLLRPRGAQQSELELASESRTER